jgi:hypothetical protein
MVMTNEKITVQQSELTAEERSVVLDYDAQIANFKEAFSLLKLATEFLKLSDPTYNDIKIAANIIGALPLKRIPRIIDKESTIHPIWLLTESWILQGKDPLPIHRASLKLLFGRDIL